VSRAEARTQRADAASPNDAEPYLAYSLDLYHLRHLSRTGMEA
jgi:hypothetical protein